MAVACAMGAVASFHRAGLYQQVLDLSDDLTREDFRTSEKWVLGPYVAFLVGPLLAGPVFIAWQRGHSRAARALAAPSGERPGLGPGWSVGGWFVPIANMVVPGVEVHQSAKASSTPSGRSSWLIPVWMATFVIGGWLTAVATTVLRPVNNPPFDDLDVVREAELANQIAFVGFALLAVAAVTGAVMVRTLTARQAQGVDVAAQGAWPQPSHR